MSIIYAMHEQPSARKGDGKSQHPSHLQPSSLKTGKAHGSDIYRDIMRRTGKTASRESLHEWSYSYGQTRSAAHTAPVASIFDLKPAYRVNRLAFRY